MKAFLKKFISENGKAGTFFVLGLMTSKGCDLAIDYAKSPNRSFSISAEQCTENETLDTDGGKKSWRCIVTFRNHTRADHALNVSCQTKQGNFFNPIKIVSRGGGSMENQSPICFDSSNSSERSCLQKLQNDEFAIVQFEVAAYEKPTVICNSDTL